MAFCLLLVVGLLSSSSEDSDFFIFRFVPVYFRELVSDATGVDSSTKSIMVLIIHPFVLKHCAMPTIENFKQFVQPHITRILYRKKLQATGEMTVNFLVNSVMTNFEPNPKVAVQIVYK